MASVTKETTEEFEQKQAEARAAQGLPAGAVPEQRPQAFNQVDPADESDRYKQELEEGKRDPMPKSAYDKANSAASAKKAEKESKKLGKEHLREGQKVVICKDGDPLDGAQGVVESVTWASQDDAVKARSGDAAVARFAKAASYDIRTRKQGALITVKPTEVDTIDHLGPNAGKL